MQISFKNIKERYFRTCNYLFHRKYRKFLRKYRTRSRLKAYETISLVIRRRVYNDEILPQDRYLMLGFDDGRRSDVEWLMPLLEKYGFCATFNVIAEGRYTERLFIDRAIRGGHEIGDHTFFHEQYPYFSPLYNGYDPNNPDGSNQEVYPSNEDMREDRGDGCNMFGYSLDEKVDYLNYFCDEEIFNHDVLGFLSPLEDTKDITWRELTDEHCQQIREYYSVISNDELCHFLDELSAEFLGTFGYSKGSYIPECGCYTQGIFTNCKTSANYEIWERIIYLSRQYQKHYNHLKYDCTVWSMPGMRCGDLFYIKDGIRYYDRNYTMPANALACAEGNYSMVSILRKYGYNVAHDIRYPSLLEGYDTPEMLHIMHRNAIYSKPDALTYYGERTIQVGNLYDTLNRMRHRMANGIVANAVWDSTYDENDIIFWEQLLAYCYGTGVKVITKSEAFDLCYNHKIEEGNLIFNPEFRNTLKEFNPECDDSNPDGYVGTCYTRNENMQNILCIDGITKYSHYGIPIGKLEYKLKLRGSGEIRIYIIRNKTKLNTEEELVASLFIHSDDICEKKTEFLLEDAPMTNYESQFEGYGDKICGIRIVYSGKMEIYEISIINVK